MTELLHDRIDRAERLAHRFKQQPAPTVPQYDLTAPSNYYLAIYGDRYNGLPGLFNIFSDNTRSDVWLRLTYLNSIASRRALFVATLVFSEWISDPYYSGGPPITIWGTNAIGIAVNFYFNRWSLSEPYSSELINDFGASDTGQAAFGGSGGGTDPVIDLHVFRTGLNSNRGGNWSSEVYANGILRFTVNHASFGDFVGGGPFAGAHPLGRDGIGGMVFGTQYASYLGYFAVDDVMVGTTQGGSDLMSVATFAGGSYAPLDDSLDGSPPSYEILIA